MQIFDVVIIGAGPAGCICASHLIKANKKVLILEKSRFPRFALGESFLSQNMVFFERAGLLAAFEGTSNLKDGANFLRAEQLREINFKDKSADGPYSTFQVRRDLFDEKLSAEVLKMGGEIFFESELLSINKRDDGLTFLEVRKNNEIVKILCHFVIDASGLSRVLPTLLGHEVKRSLSSRVSFFNHIQTKVDCGFDHKRILITIDETDSAVWFWLIPLGEKRYSLGVTLNSSSVEKGLCDEEILSHYIEKNPHFRKVLGDFYFIFSHQKILNFTSHCEKVFGDNYVLIGNSCEFIDPIFSSGVTIAGKSAELASTLVIKKLDGEKVNWQRDYLDLLEVGVHTFRSFIESWYKGELQNIIYSENSDPKIRSMIVSILAGYAWDEKNVFTKKTSERLKALNSYAISQRP